MLKNLNDKNISFIIRGYYYGGHPSDRSSNTFKLIRSIEEFFPNALIYYVIWKDYKLKENLKLLHENIQIIEIDDPGDPGLINVFNYPKKNSHKNNINRQIASAKNGLSSIKTQYTCIVRSDFLFHNKNLINLYKRFKTHNYSPKFKLFKQPILTTFFGSVNSKRTFLSRTPNYPFHPSDMFHFGLTDDLRSLFDIPLMDWDSFKYYLQHPRGYSEAVQRYDSGYLCKYLPEQYLFVSFLKKQGILDLNQFTHMEDNPVLYEDLSNSYITNSFFMVNFRELGASWQQENFRIKRLPKFYFRSRSILISSIFFHLSRYNLAHRKISFIRKIILILLNNMQLLFEFIIYISISFITIFFKIIKKLRSKIIF